MTSPNWESPGTDTDADSDSDTDADADSDSDSDSDSDTDTDTDTDADPVPLVFVIQNETTQDRYLRWDTNGQNVVECSAEVLDSWQGCLFNSPFCTLECEDIEEGDNCCIDCDYMPAVMQILAGQELEIYWDGTLAHADDDYCSECECYWHFGAPHNHYLAAIQAYQEVECWNAECDVQSDGVIWNGNVVGEPQNYFKGFDIPHPSGAGGEVVISIMD